MAVSISREDILQAIAEMSVLDVVELVKAMEEKFGVSAAAPVAVAAVGAPAAGGAAAAVEEQTEFKVVLKDIGANKINVIKVIREITGLGLKEAKDLTETPSALVKEGIPKDDAAKFKKQLEEAGATVEVS